MAKEQVLAFEGDEAAAFFSDVPMQLDAAGTSGRQYTGRRIDLDFKDADIHNILRLLSEVGDVNVVTADDVSGQVTIKMKNVPWDQALDVILSAKGLGMVRRGNLIRVAHLFDQRIDVALTLLVYPKHRAAVDDERLVVPELFCKPKVAVDMCKRHVAKAADVVLAQDKRRRYLFLFQLFQRVAKRDYRLAARPGVVEEVAG